MLQVVVLDHTTKETATFYCRRWLCKTEDDGAISRDLMPQTGDCRLWRTAVMKGATQRSHGRAACDAHHDLETLSMHALWSLKTLLLHAEGQMHLNPNPTKLRQLHLQVLWTASNTLQLCRPLTNGGLAPQQLCIWRFVGKPTQ